MELLRNLRDDYMIGNPEYRSLLLEYYVIGPIISNRLMQDQNKERIAQQLYQNYLKPTVDLLIDDKKGQAIAYYKQMVGQLKEFYHLDHLELDFGQIDRIPKLKNKEDLKQLAKKITIK